jgi:hypothetical protein
MEPNARRRSERSYERMPLTLRFRSEDGEVRWPARTVDLSQHGFRVRTNAALVPGQTIEAVSPEGHFRPVACRVAWVGSKSGNMPIDAGLEFLSPMILCWV